MPEKLGCAVFVRCAEFRERLAEESWEDGCALLPERERVEVARFRSWWDRQARLFGRLLLRLGLQELGWPPECLERVGATPRGKPFLPGGPDFNISHSGRYVVCAIAPRGRVGIDIEEIRPIDPTDFGGVLSPAELEIVAGDPDGRRRFFDFWTRREAVLKADGCGFAVSPDEVRIEGTTADLNGAVWNLKELRVDAEYRCCLATEVRSPEVRLERLDPARLFDRRPVRGARRGAGGLRASPGQDLRSSTKRT